jgi:hypothetical protein
VTTAARERAAGERYLAPHIVPMPVKGTRITEPYARMVAREAYFWAWPMVNIWNRRLASVQAPERGLMNGVLPVAPPNRLAMLPDYSEAGQRWVACPNRDVVYGSGIVALDHGPVVLQVPDFGKRFWVYQAVDLRTDSFADIGAMYGTKPGFYLIVGPGWDGDTPDDILQVLSCPTNTGMVIPRVFQDDTPDDKRAIQDVLSLIDLYPVTTYDGNVKRRDWSRLPTLSPPTGNGGPGESRWVLPETFFDQLPAVLADAPPLAGEDTRYAEVLAVIAAAQKDPPLMKVLVDEAIRTEQTLIEPLVQFRNWGTPLPHHWTTESNGAAFGSDYFMRTAIARSNILVNKPVETKYFYQDLDVDGDRLNGASRYRVTLPAGGPPVRGFWSLTLYDRLHFFAPNAIGRYSLGTKNRDLPLDADGSLTIVVQADEPTDPAQRRAWLPAPAGDDFSLYLRAYWPERAVLDGTWTPPPVRKA